MCALDKDDVYAAHIDDSGGEEEGRILLLSAAILSYPEWSAFTEAWQAVLDADPKIKHFHMRDARQLDGPFSGFDEIKRDIKIIALTEVIMQFRPHIASCWLSRDAYENIVSGVAPCDLRHAYYSCFCSITQTVAEYQSIRGITTPADYIFDNQDDIGNEALLWYAACKESSPPHVKKLMGSTPVFRDDKEVLPLQAADLIAWHKRRRKEYLGLDTEVAATLRVDDLPGCERHITNDCLRDIASDISKVPHVEEFREGMSIYKQLKRQFRKTRKSSQSKKPKKDGETP